MISSLMLLTANSSDSWLTQVRCDISTATQATQALPHITSCTLTSSFQDFKQVMTKIARGQAGYRFVLLIIYMYNNLGQVNQVDMVDS